MTAIIKDVIMPLALAARPAPFALSAGECAMLVIDMQNEFGSRGGMFDRAGIDIAPIRATIAPTAAVLTCARAAGIPIVYLQMQHRADLADLGPPDSAHHMRHRFLSVGDTITLPDGRTNRILIEGHWGTEIIAGLAPEPGDIVLPKHRFSGFFQTPLESILRAQGVRQLLVTGCTTSICVESTIRDAMFRDFQCCLLQDCCAEPIGHANSRSNHEASLLTIQTLLGWVSDSKSLIATLAA